MFPVTTLVACVHHNECFIIKTESVVHLHTTERYIILHKTNTTIMCLCWIASGCRGEVELLTEPEGLISINETEYRNNMTCGWKIRVDPSKVKDF